MANKLKLIAETFCSFTEGFSFVCGFCMKQKRHKGCALTFHFSSSVWCAKTEIRKWREGERDSSYRPTLASSNSKILLEEILWVFILQAIVSSQRVFADDPRKAQSHKFKWIYYRGHGWNFKTENFCNKQQGRTIF